MTVEELLPPAIEFTVYGIPAPKGSKAAFPIRGKDGRTRVVVTEGKKGSGIKTWTARVTEVVQGLAESGAPLLDGPVSAAIAFFLPKPKSAPKRRRVWPDRKPDIDKLLRALLDPMKGVVLADDARIVAVSAAKVYAEESDVDPRPRAEVRLWRTEELTSELLQEGTRA